MRTEKLISNCFPRLTYA